MSPQIEFLLIQVHQYIQEENYQSAKLLLNQILRIRPKHPEALRLISVMLTLQGDHEEALKSIDRAIEADKKNGIAYSNKGNILLDLGRPEDAINCYRKAIQFAPTYSEAYSNLGNAYQKIHQYDLAISFYFRAISIEPNNPAFLCNLGNAQWKLDLIDDAALSYRKTLKIDPYYVDALHNLAHLDLLKFRFQEGWRGYEYRWISNEERPSRIETSKPLWAGDKNNCRLLVWGEQGIGDQILYASMFNNLFNYTQSVIIATDKKLLNIFKKSFPAFQVVDINIPLNEDLYDQQIPMGSLGQFLRPNLDSFNKAIYKYLFYEDTVARRVEKSLIRDHRAVCGLSWSSGRAKFGEDKSVPLVAMTPILKLNNTLHFVNLQYGETSAERNLIKDSLGVSIFNLDNIDLYQDLEELLAIIDACEIIVTSSNTTAHIAGALGKETLLLLPIGNAKFWYWQNLDGKSLWYPSIKIFHQLCPGDWSDPILKAKNYLEKRFAI